MGQDLKWGHGGVIKETSRTLEAGKSGESGLFSMYVLGLSYIGEGLQTELEEPFIHGRSLRLQED